MALLETKSLSKSFGALSALDGVTLGVAFVIVVLFFRGGVVEAWSRIWRFSKRTT